MSNGTSKPKRAMQLGSAFVAVIGLVATITAFASAQTSTSVEITEEFCINKSLGGPLTYPHDGDGDGIDDVCSLPRTKRATAARQLAMERMASELELLFGHLFAQECLTVSETFGELSAERNDECAAPRLANARGTTIPPVPAAPVPEANLDSRYYSGPVVTGPSFCINKSFGGPRTYPHDVNGDGIADICSLPRTRRAAVARQNALERMAVDLKPRFDVVFAEECLRVPETLGEASAEARDECAVHRAGGTPLPNPDDPTQPDPGADTPDDGTQLPYVPPPIRPAATRTPTYNLRAAQNVQLDPGNQLIYVSWQAPAQDAGSVFKYLVQWRPCPLNAQGRPVCQGWSSTRQHDAGQTLTHTIENLTNFVTYEVRVLAQRGPSDPYSPALSATPGWSAPPVWPDLNALTSPVYGTISATWSPPTAINPTASERLTINHYVIQWDTSSGFARDCALDASCNETQISGTTYNIPGLSNGTYYVRVQGVTASGPGVWSLTQTYRLASTRPAPGQPTAVMLSTNTSNGLDVSWTAPTGTPEPTDYFVQWRNVTAGQGWSATDRQQRITGTPPAVTTTINNLTPRNEYEVQVQAINVDAASRWSSAKHVIGRALPPTEITINPEDGALIVTWNRPAGEPPVTSYFLQWGTSCSNSAFSSARQATIQSAAQTGVSYTFPSNVLTNNVRYYIRIQSINSLGSGDWSSCVSGEPGTLNAPTTPTVADPNPNTNPRALTVTWTYTRENDDVNKPHLTGFKVRSRQTGANWSSPVTVRLLPTTDPSYCDNTGTGTCTYEHTFTNLTTGVAHEFQVLATNSYGDGGWSASSTATTPGTQFQPTGVSAGVNANNIRSLDVSWTAPTVGEANISGYRVQYRRPGTTGWSTSSSSVANTATSYIITGLATGSAYEVRVVARTSFGDGPGSVANASSTATPGDGFTPTGVNMVQSADTNGVHQLQIGWVHSHSYTPATTTTTTSTYTVQWRTCDGSAIPNCTGWRTVNVTGDGATNRTYEIPVTSLQHNTYYQARVRANWPSVGGSSLYSDESSRYLVTIADNNSPQTPNDRSDDTVTVTIRS
ncbi:MAG: fibronectin type III domain-containing protein [bacterium]|nr:fibronectin type III domain-containing protein [bacterium]